MDPQIASLCTHRHPCLHPDPDPPPLPVRDVLVGEEAVLDGAVLVPAQLRLLLGVGARPELLSPSERCLVLSIYNICFIFMYIRHEP